MFLLNSRSIKKGLLVGGCLCLGTASALAGGPEEAPVSSFMAFPYTPGVSVYGLGGNDWTATGDAMVPLFGRPLNFTYIDPQIYYHSNPDSYTGSVGAGQRWLTNGSAGILGAYVFGDYNHTNDGHSFWFVSPGIESLGRTFDFSLNGYIPVSSQKVDTGTEFADEAGDFDDVTFAGHTQYDEIVNTFDSTGWGIDGQVGVRLPFRNTKVYLGGYYFAPKDSDTIGGGAIRAEVPINDYLNVVLSEAYDNEFHNTFKAGLTLWFGGRHTSYRFNGDLATRMVDPIQRNLVATAGGSRTAQPVLSGTEDTGVTAVELTNISFFVPGAGPSDSATAVQGDGSYESPYVGMTQDNVDNGNTQGNTNFYINSGTYNAVYNDSIDSNFIVLNNDQLFGRTDGFKQPASGNNRPLINFEFGGFEVPVGDTNDSFTGLQLTGTELPPVSDGGNVSTGIFVNHDVSSSPTTPDLTVSIDNTVVQNFGDGIDILNGSGAGNVTVNVNNSLVNNSTGIGGELGYVDGGIAALNFGNQLTLNISKSTISNTALDPDFNGEEVAGGIAVVNYVGGNALNLNINQSTISNNNNNEGDTISNAAGGIAGQNAGNVMTINIKNSTISDNSITNSDADVVGGIAVENDSGGSSLTLNVLNTVVKDNMGTTNDYFDAAGGIAVANFGDLSNASVSSTTVNIIGSKISNNDGEVANAAGGIAVYNENGLLTLNVTNSTVNGNTSYDANADGGIAAYNDFGTSTINVIGSRITNNIGNFTFAGGGIAAQNQEDTLILNVTGSTVTGNSGDDADAAGGIAVENDFNSLLTLNVTASNISTNTGINTTAGGGIAIYNIQFGASDINSNVTNAVNLTVTGSNITNNMSFAANVAGGIALFDHLESVYQNTQPTVNLTVTGSNISNNYSSNTLVAGGIAIEDVGDNIMLDVSNSSIIGNTAFSDLAAGGIALFNVGGGVTMHVNDSIISDNTGNDATVAGGVAVYNLAGSDTLSFKRSNIFGNTGNAFIAGGIAVFNDSNSTGTDITVTKSIIAHNSGDAAYYGGIAVYNAFGTMTLDVSRSKLLNNDGAGILAVSGFSSTTTAVTVDQSLIAGNDIGIYLEGAGVSGDITNSVIVHNNVGVETEDDAYATIEKSIVAFNKTALEADYYSAIDVVNPIFFSGTVNVDGTSTITFFPSGLTPSNGQKVVCIGDACHIQMNP